MTTTTVRITRMVTPNEVDAILKWLDHYAGHYEFSNGMELVTFRSVADAVAFKLRFRV